MMKGLFLSSTAAFWCAIAALWVNSIWTSGDQTPEVKIVEKSYTFAEVAEHDGIDSCWMMIRGGVYDLTEYLPFHPTNLNVIAPFCGKDATLAYNTKNRGRSHSPLAIELLERYRIGTFAP